MILFSQEQKFENQKHERRIKSSDKGFKNQIRFLEIDTPSETLKR